MFDEVFSVWYRNVRIKGSRPTPGARQGIKSIGMAAVILAPLREGVAPIPPHRVSSYGPKTRTDVRPLKTW